MEVSTVVTLIFQAAKQIYEAVQQVKDNKTQSSRLSDRINAVINPLTPYIENLEQIHSTLKPTLNNLLTCIEEAKSFISGFADSNCDLVFEDRVGFGSFADVYRGTWKSQSKTVAIKHIRINHLHYNVEQSFLDELSLMYRLRDENIINVLGACMEPNYYAIVIEYMPLGSVFSVKLNTPFAWPDRWSIALQMAKGINYLHVLNPPILHRDIKSVNFLLTKRFDDLIVKVCDFGLSEIKQESARQSKVTDKTTVGSLPWKAPELFTMGGSHTVKSDIYSLGITFWELTSRDLPYQEYADDVTILAHVTNGKRLDIPLDTPDSYRSIITISWDQNPEKRPLCLELIKLIDEAKTTGSNTR
ncbi:unnamed protein product [Rotaria sp. Silwood2]|nr:unnamed protein product [Rotaria sp. Silwood2]